MQKLLSILALFRQGNAVSNPVLWKNGGITVALLVPVLMALGRVLESFGFGIPFTEDEAATTATGLLVVVHVVFTLITSDKVGLPANPAHLTPRNPAGFGDSTS